MPICSLMRWEQRSLRFLEIMIRSRRSIFDGRGFVQADELLKVGEYLRNPAMADYIRTTRKGITSLWEKMEEMNGHEMDKIHALFKSQDDGWKQSSGSWSLGI